MDPRRLELAEQFLREAVFRSRERQAASIVLVKTHARGNCGLGEKALVVLDPSPRAIEIASELWPEGLDDAALERVRAVSADWIVEQDAIDRERNHLLKAIRTKHGFDRDAYTTEVREQLESGLDRVNAKETARRREAAAEIVRE